MKVHLIVWLVSPLVHVLDERGYEVEQPLDLVHTLHLCRGLMTGSSCHLSTSSRHWLQLRTRHLPAHSLRDQHHLRDLHPNT